VSLHLVPNSRPNTVLARLARSIPNCRLCPELRSYCALTAQTKRRSFAEWKYWGRPVPSFGDQAAQIVIVGLAPAAHGANRTGRMFTGDRSGDFLYAALHRAGLANQPTSERIGDGLELKGVYITAAARCAPPGNKPTPGQLENCRPYLIQELAVLRPAVIICLGAIGWNSALAALATGGIILPKPRPKFGHGIECRLGSSTVLGCYHVSQQNTFTGRLTAKMIDQVIERAKAIASGEAPATQSAADTRTG